MGLIDNGKIAVHQNKNGCLEIFARTTGGEILHKQQIKPNGEWGSWRITSGVSYRNLTVYYDKDGILEIFARKYDGTIWHKWQIKPNGEWSSWRTLGGNFLLNFTVHHGKDGRLEIFASDSNGKIWRKQQTNLNNHTYGSWRIIGYDFVSNVAVHHNEDGRLEIFARKADGTIQRRRQRKPNGKFGGWKKLGGGSFVSNIAVHHNKDGCLEIFARKADGTIWHKWQEKPNGRWNGDEELKAENVNKDTSPGRVRRFDKTATKHRVMEKLTIHDGWKQFDKKFNTDVTVHHDKDDRIQLFVRGKDNAIWLKQQSSPNSHTYHHWRNLGGDLNTDVTVHHDEDGSIQLFARGKDNSILYNRQVGPNKGWHKVWKTMSLMKGVGINIILVGSDYFEDKTQFLEGSIGSASSIFEKVDFTIADATLHTIHYSEVDAWNHKIISSDSEAIDLTRKYSVLNNYLDVFIVRTLMTGDGQAPVNGPCSKSSNRMDGAIVEINLNRTGVILAHEIGHYLGLAHTYEPNDSRHHSRSAAEREKAKKDRQEARRKFPKNFMVWNADWDYTNITLAQRNRMVKHCFVRSW